MLGPRLRDLQGSGPVGRRATQHVEADPAGGPLVPWRQPTPVATLLAIPGAAVEGKNGGASNTRLGPCGSPTPELTTLSKGSRSPVAAAPIDLAHAPPRPLVPITRC